MASDAAPAAAAGGSSKQRRKKKKPAGSKWLNYLLGLGCLASLLPLWFEYHGKKQEPWVPQPHKDDPWVRVIDATAVEKEARRSGKVKTRYPRLDLATTPAFAYGQSNCSERRSR